MSVSVGRAKLKNAMLELLAAWEETEAVWQDARARQIQSTVIEPLEPAVRAALSAMDRMSALMIQAEQECGDR